MVKLSGLNGSPMPVGQGSAHVGGRQLSHLGRGLLVVQKNPELRPQFESELVRLLDPTKSAIGF